MKLIKEIRSKEGKLHFRRWQLLKTPWFSIYIHGIYAPDQDKHLHNHPWDYKSLVLKGSYIEETNNGVNLLKFGSVTSRNGEDYHKIKTLLTNSVYTLFIVSPAKRTWGYQVNGKCMYNEEYRKLKNQNLL
jgi:hypothetical protein